MICFAHSLGEIERCFVVWWDGFFWLEEVKFQSTFMLDFGNVRSEIMEP